LSLLKSLEEAVVRPIGKGGGTAAAWSPASVTPDDIVTGHEQRPPRHADQPHRRKGPAPGRRRVARPGRRAARGSAERTDRIRAGGRPAQSAPAVPVELDHAEERQLRAAPFTPPPGGHQGPARLTGA